MRAKQKEDAKVEGVPKETPERNSLAEVRSALATVLGGTAARQFIRELERDGYFDLALLDQGRFLTRRIAALPMSERIIKTLLDSPVDRLRALGVSVHFEINKDNLTAMLKSLQRTGALPGTWTQETSQATLKEVIHYHSLAKVLPRISGWVADGDANVRRMVVEALRPRGVWCKHIAQLKADPSLLKLILEKVLDDDSEYVRKAVANSLNDISKDNPDVLLRWVASWLKGAVSPQRRWIIERGLRTLVKANDPKAMKLMGYESGDEVDIRWLPGIPQELVINTQIPFELRVENHSPRRAKIRLQVLMYCPGKNGRERISKYLLGQLELGSGKTANHSRRVLFAHKNSVPKLPGRYRLVVECNGRKIGERSFRYQGKDARPADHGSR